MKEMLKQYSKSEWCTLKKECPVFNDCDQKFEAETCPVYRAVVLRNLPTQKEQGKATECYNETHDINFSTMMETTYGPKILEYWKKHHNGSYKDCAKKVGCTESVALKWESIARKKLWSDYDQENYLYE